MIAQKSSVSHIAWQGIEDIVRWVVLAFHESGSQHGMAVNKQCVNHEIQKFINSLVLMKKDDFYQMNYFQRAQKSYQQIVDKYQDCYQNILITLFVVCAMLL